MARFKCKNCGYIFDEEREDTSFLDLPDDWVCGNIDCNSYIVWFDRMVEDEEIDDTEIRTTEEKGSDEDKKVLGEPPQLEFDDRHNLTIRFLEYRRTNSAEIDFIFRLDNHARRHIENVLAIFEGNRQRFDNLFLQVFAGDNPDDIDVVVQRYRNTLEGMKNRELHYFRAFKPADNNARIYARAIHGALAKQKFREIYKGIENLPDRVTILYPLFFEGIPVESIVKLVDNLDVLQQNVVNTLWHRIGILIHEATHHYANTDDNTPDTIDNGYYYGSFAIALIHDVTYENLA